MKTIDIAKQAGGTVMTPHDYGAEPDRMVLSFNSLETFRTLCVAEEHKRLMALGMEPVAWAMRWPDGSVFDVICPKEHDRFEGDYTMPLYAAPPAAVVSEPVGYVDADWAARKQNRNVIDISPERECPDDVAVYTPHPLLVLL